MMRKITRGILLVASCCLLWNLPAAVFAQTGSGAAESSHSQLAPTKEQKRINANIVDQLKTRHYRKIDLDDQMSSKILDRYFDELDPGHIYFYEQDIKEFAAKYRFALDDALNEGNLEPGFEIFNRYQQRVTERLTYLIARLEQGLEDMDFSIEETMQMDRKEMPWPGSEAEMQELWRKRLKSNVLSLKLADKSLEQIQETLLKRFRNQLNRITLVTIPSSFI